jgi:hypothetical protein
MTTRLADVQFDEDVYLSYIQEDRPDRNAYIASGVAVTNAQLTQRAAGEGEITSIPYWKDLNTENENISSDDPAQRATPEKIETGRLVARRVHINNAWQSANLVSAVIGSEDPMRQIASRTAKYWENRFAARVQAMTLGIYLENEAGTGDMIFDVSGEAGADGKWSYEGFVDAVATMGESADALSLIAVHPKTMAQMRKQQAIEFIQDSNTGLMIPTYNGYRVVEDKKMPVLEDGPDDVFVSVLYRGGVIGYGEALAPRAVATEFDELAANGAGVETLVERKQWLIHPEGYKWLEDTVADESPTVAEVANPDNWERQYQRENVGIAFFVHK